MYALYKNVSLSVSFSGDDGFEDEKRSDIKYFIMKIFANMVSLALMLENGC